MNYKNFGTYINTGNGSSPNLYIPAANISVDYQSQANAKRKLGPEINSQDEFNHGSALQSKISFTAYINSLYTGSLAAILSASGDIGYTIKVGENLFSGCYLNNYNVDVQPFKPAMISADFLISQPQTNYAILSGAEINLADSFVSGMVHGYSCAVSGMDQVVDVAQSSIRYSVSCSRTPSYGLGSINPINMFLDSVEKQMDISSTNITSLINFSGSQLSGNLGVILKDAQNITGASIIMNSGAKLLSQQYSNQEGDILATQVSVKQIVV